MHPVTVFPTRPAPHWRGPALLAAAGIAALLVVLRRRPARPFQLPAGRRASRR
ncbi:hypothetical protein [Massilia sp. DWR3-1-1]|uniref:hypothetical protein n=1 Tax=Massilia sp. DWR3-1-1 TaxID=2804559 RepID=UPI003CEC20BF